MFPYLLLLGFVLFWIFLEKKSLNRKAFWVPSFALIVFATIRNSTVGTDTGLYVKNFVNKLDPDYYEFHEGMESGYLLLEYIILNISHNYFWLFFITSIIVVFLQMVVIKKYSINYILSIFIFITLGGYTFFLNGLRQGIAMAIFFVSLPFLINKNFLKYFLICIFASFFHISALFMIPFYFIVNLKWKIEWKIIFIFLSSLLLSKSMINLLADSNEKYAGYTEVSDSSGGFLILLFYFVVFLLIYLIKNKINIKDNKEFNALFQFYSCGLFFILGISFLQTNPSGPQRLLSYFILALIFIIPIVLKNLNNKLINLFVIIFLIVYFMLRLDRFANYVPYIINPYFEIF